MSKVLAVAMPGGTVKCRGLNNYLCERVPQAVLVADPAGVLRGRLDHPRQRSGADAVHVVVRTMSTWTPDVVWAHSVLGG
jgi:hypothetical protein